LRAFRHRPCRTTQITACPGIRVGYIGDSILQGNNLAAPDGHSITALANREITWTRALYPHFNIDTWVASRTHFGISPG
jgi:hypothetical protein